LQTLRALDTAKIQTRGDLIFVFTVQEELGLKGMYYWMDHNPAPAMVVASDGALGDVKLRRARHLLVEDENSRRQARTR